MVDGFKLIILCKTVILGGIDMKKILLGMFTLGSVVALGSNNNMYVKTGVSLDSRFSRVNVEDVGKFKAKGKVGNSVNLELTRSLSEKVELGVGVGYIRSRGTATLEKEFTYLTKSSDIQKVDVNKLESNEEIESEISALDSKIAGIDKDYTRILNSKTTRIIKTVEDVRNELKDEMLKFSLADNAKDPDSQPEKDVREEIDDVVDGILEEVLKLSKNSTDLAKNLKKYIDELEEIEDDGVVSHDPLAPEMKDLIEKYVYAQPVSEVTEVNKAELDKLLKEKENLIAEKKEILNKLQMENKKIVRRTIKAEIPRYDSFPLYVTGKYNFNTDSEIKPYVKVDLGYSFNRTRGHASYSDTITMDGKNRVLITEYIKPKVKNGIYYSAGVGLEYYNFVTELTYVHRDAKIKWSDGSKSKYNNNLVQFAVGYRFSF